LSRLQQIFSMASAECTGEGEKVVRFTHIEAGDNNAVCMDQEWRKSLLGELQKAPNHFFSQHRIN